MLLLLLLFFFYIIFCIIFVVVVFCFLFVLEEKKNATLSAGMNLVGHQLPLAIGIKRNAAFSADQRKETKMDGNTANRKTLGTPKNKKWRKKKKKRKRPSTKMALLR